MIHTRCVELRFRPVDESKLSYLDEDFAAYKHSNFFTDGTFRASACFRVCSCDWKRFFALYMGCVLIIGQAGPYSCSRSVLNEQVDT